MRTRARDVKPPDEFGATSQFRPGNSSTYLDHEIAQLTKLRTEPHQRFSRAVPGGLKFPVSTVRMLAGRECNYSGRGRFTYADSCHLLSQCVPVNGPWMVDSMDCVNVSQFSKDGSLFIAACKSNGIRIYDVDTGWTVRKNIQARRVTSTITDTSLSPDQRYLVYSSLSPIVHIVNVGSAATEPVANVTGIHDGLNFSFDNNDDFGICSVKFSTDGRELVAASNNKSMYFYDVEANKLACKIPAHEDDVNTVCFADETGHLLYSGSDDSLCKVWDRRCIVTKAAVGTLVGHRQGITSIDSHGDGRYLISNGRDDSIKLWDIRKMSCKVEYPQVANDLDYIYIWMNYLPHMRKKKHPNDQSLATYRGHKVLNTLIRCYFSPIYSTGQKYIYTGSSDNSVYIYDLVSGAEVGKLSYHTGPVRDCSWHPIYPMLVSCSWDGDIVRWEFRATGAEPLCPKRFFPYSRVRRRGFVEYLLH